MNPPRRVHATTIPFAPGVWLYRLVRLADADGPFWHWFTIGRIG